MPEPHIDVLQLGPWLGAELREAIAAPFVVHSLFDASGPHAVFERCASQIRALICHSGGPLTTRALLNRLPKLELILNLGAGTESVDTEAAQARGIPVLNSVGFNAVDVAELAMGLVLALGRDLVEGDRHVRGLHWLQGRSPIVHRVSGKRIGILGMGAIGQQIARRAAAFDMEVTYFSRRAVPDVPWQFVPDLLALARHVDYLVMTLPGGEATLHLVGEAVLNALGPTGFIVNVGRGTVLDEKALAAALQEGRIAGAGLDVFEDEPNVPDALLLSRQTVLQSHRGGLTFEAHDAIVQETVARLHRHFKGDRTFK
ncbi:Lactate dehydrogenase [Variovorax sp. YR266]|uniref:2-hydroxyacid dehydrogenase n=1 Tax=Variovorax sp. YR266 TaxID=1884386 RepID=UPI00089A45E2|nr:2-hydroxyacid dehydrogenase [Variovorax sp. YR266]SDY33669.1 Lactate dehydrogenase [Variovorax sp. YR266]